MLYLKKRLRTSIAKRLALCSLFASLIFMPAHHFLDADASRQQNPDVSTAVITSTTSNCPGDFDGNREVNLADFLAFVEVFGKSSSDAGFDVRMDFDGNREVNLADFLAFVEVFGSTCPDFPTTITPPPNWIFAGDIPQEDQTVLREEMEYCRSYFSTESGIEATGFTVLVGADYEALSPVYRDVVGTDLSNHYHPQAKYAYAWVTSSATGSAVMTLMYGTLAGNEVVSKLKHHIAHEYFHVLQGQLASGNTQLHNGEIAWWHTNAPFRGPNWLVEGLASYADYVYTPSRPRSERRPFMGNVGRYSPYEDLEFSRLSGSLKIGDLEKISDYRTFRCTFSNLYSYALSFAASTFLVEQSGEDSYVNYWKLLQDRPTWQQAFEESFGIGVNDFYKAFDEWLPSQLPSRVRLSIQMLWPGIESPGTTWRFLYLNIENWGIWENTRPSPLFTGNTGKSRLPFYLTFQYPAGAIGTGYLSLWWSDDQCTAYLLGWYKDGALTDQREEATLVEFTGISSSIAWTLPGHPDTLPRLEERERVAGCQ